MPANGKAERGSTSLLYDNNNNEITDHNNNHVTTFNSNQDNSESNEQLSHSNTSSPNLKKELSDFNDLADQSSQCNEEDLNEDEQLNDLDDDEDDHLEDVNNNVQQQQQQQQPHKSTTRSILSSKLSNGVLQSSPLSNLFSNELNQSLEKQSKLLNHLNLTKGDLLINNKNNKDGDSILESLSNLTGLNSLSSLNSLNQFNQLNNSSLLTNLNNQLNSLNNLAMNQATADDYGVLLNTNDDDDEDSSNMVITPDIGDYASYNDDDLDDHMMNKPNLIDDDEELDNDLLNDNCSKDEREGCRSLICDSSGIIIAEMVYRCMVCSNISDSITDAQRHYQMKHIFNQSVGLNSTNSALNNYNWKAANSANSSRSSNSSNNLNQQLKNKEIQRKKIQRMQELKMHQRIQQLQRAQQQAKLKEQAKQQQLKQQKNQRLIQLQQQQLQNQLQQQQNQRLEQLRQQQQLNEFNNQIQQLHQQQQQQQQQQSNSDSPQQQQSIPDRIPDLNSLFLNPPQPGTVSKTPQSAHGSSRGGYVTCAVCSITKFYASVQRRYGQFTCMGCAKFFGRFLAKPKKFNCPNLGSCALNTSPRCKACLLLACINTYTIDEKRKLVVNANRPVQRGPGPSGSGLIGRASDSVKRKSAKIVSSGS